MSKRILVIILTVCLAVVGMTVMVFADIASGTDWVLAGDGTLTISSDAGMNNWTDNDRNTYGSSVKSVIIESGVTYIRSYAFYYHCTNLESVSIPDTVKTIDISAFNNCKSLTLIIIPDSVETIGDSAFSNCTNLETVTLGSGVETIGNSAFANCESLTSITIPDSVKTISNNTFYNCTSLATVTLGIGLETIGESAFRYCTSLTSIEIPSGVTTINNSTFNGCSNLTSVSIPSSVTTIGRLAFYPGYGASNAIVDVYYEGTSTQWSDISVGDGNTNLTDAFIHYNCTSTSTHTLSAEYTWTDVTSCTVTLTCSCTGSKAIEAEITSETTQASCSKDGNTVYTATATFNGSTYTNKQRVTIAATGNHSYDAGVVTKEATCTEGGVKTYTCSVCGDSYTEAISATGHSYTVTACDWSSDYTSATLTLTCDNCSDEQPVVATEIESEVTTAAQCEDEGAVLYTAKATYNNVEYAYSVTVASTATGHTFGTPEIVWASDNTATATVACQSCGAVQNLEVTVTSTTDSYGNTIYTATVTYNGQTYTSEQTVEAVKTTTSKSEIYTTLSRIQASYTGVQAAIEKANSLNPDDYENFSAVTEAIEAVDWSLNVLNQKLVNSYAEAIEEAIENLVPVSTTEEVIEIDEPVEAGDTDVE